MDYEDGYDLDEDLDNEKQEELPVSDEENEDDFDEKNTNTLLDTLKVKNKKMYFDEERVKRLIMEEYQPYLDYGTNEKGKRVCVSRERASKEVEKEIMGNLLLIANAIINKYRYWRFEPIDDLQAEALQAMWYYLPNFTPGKGTVFNLFSIICKKDLLNYTLKNYKHRDTSDIDAQFDLASNEETNYNVLFTELEKTFLNIIDRHYVREQRDRYRELTAILMQYLDKNKKVVGKNDLMAAFKEYGYKSTEYKKFIEEISKYKDEFYSLVS